jgi:hypothetical protein
LLRYFLNDFEMVPVTPVITGITFVLYIIIIKSQWFSWFSSSMCHWPRTYWLLCWKFCKCALCVKYYCCLCENVQTTAKIEQFQAVVQVVVVYWKPTKCTMLYIGIIVQILVWHVSASVCHLHAETCQGSICNIIHIRDIVHLVGFQ